MIEHPKAGGHMVYRWNPRTKRLQFWSAFQTTERWENSVSFMRTYADTAALAAEHVRLNGYRFARWESTWCERAVGYGF